MCHCGRSHGRARRLHQDGSTRECAPIPAGAGPIVRLDPALDTLVPAGAVVEKIAGGFQFTEGPLWRPSESRLWFSDVVGNVLRAVTPSGQVEVLIEHAAGQSTAPAGSVHRTEWACSPKPVARF